MTWSGIVDDHAVDWEGCALEDRRLGEGVDAGEHADHSLLACRGLAVNPDPAFQEDVEPDRRLVLLL
jgi:hypothetical protein